MKKTDKLLIGIVSGILLLVVVAFVVALSKPEPAYQAEDTPDGVAFNYLFALQQKDYKRAYGYLFPAIKGYPGTFSKFTSDIQNHSYTFSRLNDSSTTLEVESFTVTGTSADVRIRETRFYERDLFNSSQYTSSFTITLSQKKDGSWKIVESGRYWYPCWSNPQGYGCK
jgi:hypothetical protein